MVRFPPVPPNFVILKGYNMFIIVAKRKDEHDLELNVNNKWQTYFWKHADTKTFETEAEAKADIAKRQPLMITRTLVVESIKQ